MIYAPPAFVKMRDEAQRTGANLVEIADALTAVRATYLVSAQQCVFINNKGFDVFNDVAEFLTQPPKDCGAMVKW